MKLTECYEMLNVMWNFLKKHSKDKPVTEQEWDDLRDEENQISKEYHDNKFMNGLLSTAHYAIGDIEC